MAMPCVVWRSCARILGCGSPTPPGRQSGPHRPHGPDNSAMTTHPFSLLSPPLTTSKEANNNGSVVEQTTRSLALSERRDCNPMCYVYVCKLMNALWAAPKWSVSQGQLTTASPLASLFSLLSSLFSLLPTQSIGYLRNANEQSPPPPARKRGQQICLDDGMRGSWEFKEGGEKENNITGFFVPGCRT
jgi:hypothetical protein